MRATSISFPKTSAGGRLEIEPVSNNSPHITISLPACAALELRLTAGELVLDAAPCQSTTVSMHAGELRARMSDPDIFRSLRASVAIGQIDAPGLGPGERDTDAGGFFRSFKRSGSGSRTFAAHVGTGQITLDGRKQSKPPSPAGTAQSRPPSGSSNAVTCRSGPVATQGDPPGKKRQAKLSHSGAGTDSRWSGAPRTC